MITLSHLTKQFGAFAAVDDLSLKVAPNQALALWGPNGAGKTTVLKCLLGLLRYRGTIEVGGIDIQRQGRQARRLIGYVPQELAFYDDMNTAETVAYFARLRKVTLPAVSFALAPVGLAEHGDKAVGALSGGMKQRLALALALLGDPPVLVLDEPTSNLDAGARAQFLQLLARVKADGKTVLFTSHRLDEVEALADHVLVMEQGRERFTCPAAQLAHRLNLRSQVKLLLPSAQIDPALTLLTADGFQARRNGVGILVDVPHNAKASPIHLLSRAAIEVTDFDMEK
jgi:ABC-2 type transport system ATP-binding protein/nitrous oxidase accessory protein